MEVGVDKFQTIAIPFMPQLSILWFFCGELSYLQRGFCSCKVISNGSFYTCAFVESWSKCHEWVVELFLVDNLRLLFNWFNFSTSWVAEKMNWTLREGVETKHCKPLCKMILRLQASRYPHPGEEIPGWTDSKTLSWCPTEKSL